MTDTEFIFRPLQNVPPYQDRQASRFKASWTQTMKDLDREMWYLGARSAIIQIDCDESQIRLDGLPRSDARVNSPAVAITFECVRGHLTYPCDTYTSWKDNIRAIAKGLEALRAVDRYGITSNGQQYTGWKAITFRSASFDTSDEAARWLAGLSFIGQTVHDILNSKLACKSAISLAVRTLHPDTATGSSEQFQLALAARETLERYHDTIRIG